MVDQAQSTARDLLSRSSAFGQARPETRERLAAAARIQTHRRGALVFCEGDRADSAFIVATGLVKVTCTSADGREVALAIVRPPDSLGELAALDGGVRSATAVALQPTTLVVLSRSAVTEAVQNDGALAAAFIVALTGLVRRSNDLRADLLFLGLPGRVAKHILGALRAGGDASLELELTQTDLAQVVGASRQSVNQVLRGFERSGLVHIAGRHLTVLRDDALREISEGCPLPDSFEPGPARP